ncbi:MAG: sugar phosphate isomerase/epimerase, partial [Terriglobia bacterium]
MKTQITRRDFSRLSGIAAAVAPALFAADVPTRKLKIGHTGITWNNNSEAAVRDISELGYYGFETFGNVLENWAADPDFEQKIGKYKLPLISGYCGINLTDPAKKQDSLDKLSKWGGLIKKYGGNIVVIGPNGVPRATYDFKANKANIVAMLNESSKLVADMGLTAVL